NVPQEDRQQPVRADRVGHTRRRGSRPHPRPPRPGGRLVGCRTQRGTLMTATTPEQAEERTVIRRPGLYDLPEHIYHADPVPGGSLPSTGAWLLLECPARFRYEHAHPPVPRPHVDFGTAAHKLVLGVGPEPA